MTSTNTQRNTTALGIISTTLVLVGATCIGIATESLLIGIGAALLVFGVGIEIENFLGRHFNLDL